MLIVITGHPPSSKKSSRRRKTFEALGQAATEFGIPLILSTPRLVDLKQKSVEGWKYDPGGNGRKFLFVEERVENFVIYDAMYLADLKRFRKSYRVLRSRLQTGHWVYFNPVLPGKDVVYRALSGGQLGPGHLPTTFFEVTPNKVLELVAKKNRIWLKPVYGSGGRNIAVVEGARNGQYRVIAERFFGENISRLVDERALVKLIRHAQQQRSYLAQEDVSLVKTADGRKVDFRVTVQRDETGEWRVISVTGRFGAKGSVLTNFHAGGEVRSLTQWTTGNQPAFEELGINEKIIARVKRTALRAAKTLQASFPTLGLLGVDVGISTNGKLYVYDCNGRPGRDILTDEEVRMAMRAVAGYASLLLKGGLNVSTSQSAQRIPVN